MLKIISKAISKVTLALLVSVLAFGMTFNDVMAAWTGTDSFESGYTNGADIAGIDGGTGFGAWAGNTEFNGNSVTPIVGAMGVLAVATDAGGNVSRPLDSVTTSGVMRIACRRSLKTTGTFICADWRDNAVTTLVTVRFGTADLVILGATSQTLISDYSIATVYYVDMKYNTGTNSYQARACATAPCTVEAYSTAVGRVDTLDTGIGSIGVRCSSDCSGTVEFDAISDGEAVAGGSSTAKPQKSAMLRRRR